jgi:hypothetical protein
MFEDYTDDAAASLAANQNFKTCATRHVARLIDKD